MGEPPRAESIETARLTLDPLLAEDADEMVHVLDDTELHRYTGGRPADLARLRERYRWLAGGRSPDGRSAWLNWIARLRSTGEAIGTVQATVEGNAAEIAWIVGVPWQGNGFASEAVRALVAWLDGQAVTTIAANIHPDHGASAEVARRAGLALTTDVVDGEQVWRRVRLP